MTQQQIIEAINALANVVEANKGFVSGSEKSARMANQKIQELIPLLEV